MNNSPTATSGGGMYAVRTFLRLLCTRRRLVYFLVSLILVLLIKYIYRPVMPMPVWEYFTTYRIKYSDPGQGERASKTFSGDAYRPQWAMLNPYDRDMAIKYFESTKMVIDARRKINYTVRYWHEGVDVYEFAPIDIRFVGDSISDFDSWNMRVEVRTDGVEISKVKGKYNGKPVKSADPVFVPYGTPTETAVGAVRVTSVRPIGKYRTLVVTKMREVDAQDTYDAKMRRHMGSNLIELFLTADCTRAFARDFFHQIRREYEAYARSYYIDGLKRYLVTLDSARHEVAAGYGYLGQYGIEARAGDETTRRALLAELDQMIVQAQTDGLLLQEGQMVEILDDTLIRSPKQSETSLPYVNMGLILLFFLLPVLALVVELMWRRPVLSPTLLPGEWASETQTLRLPTPQGNPIEWDRLSIQLAQLLRRYGSVDQWHLVDCETDPIGEVSEVFGRLSPELQRSGRVLPSLDRNLDGLRALAESKTPLVVRVRCTYTTASAVDKLYDWCRTCGVSIIILWDERINK